MVTGTWLIEFLLFQEGLFSLFSPYFTTYNAGVIGILGDIVAIGTRGRVFGLVVLTFKCHMTFRDPLSSFVVWTWSWHNFFRVDHQAISTLRANLGNRRIFTYERSGIRAWSRRSFEAGLPRVALPILAGSSRWQRWICWYLARCVALSGEVGILFYRTASSWLLLTVLGPLRVSDILGSFHYFY